MAGEYLAELLGAAAMRLLEVRLTKVIKLSNPAVATNFSVNVPGGAIWEPLAFTFRMTASAAVGNRSISLTYADADGNTVGRFSIVSNVVASQSVGIGFYEGLGSAYTGSTICGPLPSPSMPLPNGFNVATIVGAMDVADQLSGGVLVVREWSETDVVQEAMMIDAQLSARTEREVTGR